MQKTLTSVASLGRPLREQAAGEPVSVSMVASPFPNAPEWRCSQVVNGTVPQSAFAEQTWAGGPWNAVALELPQKPQKTFWPLGAVKAVLVTVPVLSANGIGSAPMYLP